MGKLYNAIDISRYIINYSNDKDYCISNLKLQKLLYFVQTQFIIEKGMPCFVERIEAWGFGVVVPESYSEFKKYGLSNIPYIKSYLLYIGPKLWDAVRVEYDDSYISSEDKALINEVVDELSDYSSSDLLNISSHQAPYMDAYARGKGTEIAVEAIKKYFSE